ncbi:MAG: hypothetical protein WD356_10855 [Pseudomonadales bacterium]
MLFWKIHYILQQAQALIPEEFTIADLNAGLEILHQLHSTNPIWHLQIDALKKLEETGDEEGGVSATPPYEHFLRSEFVEQRMLSDDRPYRWSWLFAVGALACISDYAWLFRTGLDKQEMLDTETNPLELTGLGLIEREDLLIEGTEYLGYARLFRERENPNEAELGRREKISKTKLDNYHDVKKAVILERRKLPQDMPKQTAAKAIYNALPEKLQLNLTAEPPFSTINTWLRQIENNELPGQENLPALWE